MCRNVDGKLLWKLMFSLTSHAGATNLSLFSRPSLPPSSPCSYTHTIGPRCQLEWRLRKCEKLGQGFSHLEHLCLRFLHCGCHCGSDCCGRVASTGLQYCHQRNQQRSKRLLIVESQQCWATWVQFPVMLTQHAQLDLRTWCLTVSTAGTRFIYLFVRFFFCISYITIERTTMHVV